MNIKDIIEGHYDYIFTIGLILIPIGLYFQRRWLWLLGVILIVIGLINKKKWPKKKFKTIAATRVHEPL